MSFRDAQEEVDKWAQQFSPAYWQPLEQMTELTEEVGEVARVLNRMYGPKKAKSQEEVKCLEEELIDAIFPIICIANREGINLDEAWKKRMEERLYQRDKDRYLKK